jgi:hypothetical protein
VHLYIKIKSFAKDKKVDEWQKGRNFKAVFFKKSGENFKNFSRKMCREKILNSLVCCKSKNVEKHFLKAEKKT